MDTQVYNDDFFLIEAFRNGDEQSFNLLALKYEKKLKARISRILFTSGITRIDPQDVYQEVLCKVFIILKDPKKNNIYEEKGKFLNWIYRVIKNYIRDVQRKESQISIKSYDNDTENKIIKTHIDVPERDYYDEENEIENLKNLVDLLPPLQRDVILLKLYKDLKFKEIANQTNCDINTALARFRLGIERLRKLTDRDKFVL